MSNVAGAPFRFETATPRTAIPADIREEVAAISPSFVDVYNQALAAESFSLGQLTGIGLRKALEFLVKDFAIHRDPSSRDAVEKAQLGECINNYLNDPQLKLAASRAAWLGNDETHYVKRWADKDISDLKLLIRLTMNFMDNVLLTEKYAQEMPGRQDAT